jgi:hypothetical protein
VGTGASQVSPYLSPSLPTSSLLATLLTKGWMVMAHVDGLPSSSLSSPTVHLDSRHMPYLTSGGSSSMGYDDQDDIPKKSSDYCRVDSGLNIREIHHFQCEGDVGSEHHKYCSRGCRRLSRTRNFLLHLVSWSPRIVASQFRGQTRGQL